MHSPEYTSPVEQSIAKAEATISDLVAPDTEGAAWDMAKNDWVVGSNVAEAGDAKLLVTQSLGPNGQVMYGATVDGEKIAWQQGATSTGELRHGHDRYASSFSNNQLALGALARISSAHAAPIRHH